jgi:hypothetical protein
MLGVAEQMGEQALEVGNERCRRSLQLDIVILASTHCSSRRGLTQLGEMVCTVRDVAACPLAKWRES